MSKYHYITVLGHPSYIPPNLLNKNPKYHYITVLGHPSYIGALMTMARLGRYHYITVLGHPSYII